MLTVSAAFWFVLALLFAAMEVENEGKYGWAEKAPTWYRTTGIAGKLYGLFMGGKPMTGYHIFTFFLSLLVFHIPFFAGKEWSPPKELEVVGLWFAWSCVWDYLWFVLNPYYGVKNFKRTKVWWHAKSWWFMGIIPADYLFGWGFSVALVGLAGWISKDFKILANHLWLLAMFVAFTVFTILVIAPLYQKWYWLMRRKDDRNKTDIFHA